MELKKEKEKKKNKIKSISPIGAQADIQVRFLCNRSCHSSIILLSVQSYSTPNG